MKPETARTLAALVIIAASLFLVGGFVAPVCWSCLIAISTWPLRDRLRSRNVSPRLTASALTLAVVLLLCVPLACLAYRAAREVPALLRIWAESRDSGLPAPEWLGNLPLVGAWALRQWRDLISEPGALSAFVHDAARGVGFDAGRSLVLGIGHRALGLFFSIVVLYFVYRDGERLALEGRVALQRQFGRAGVETVELAVRAIRGAVNGLVLVGLAMALILSIAYLVAGVEHPVFWGLVTGLAGMVPFGALAALGGVALYLFATGAGSAALVLSVFGTVLIFVTDHFVRPIFIAGSASLPLVLALLGVVGGLETFGLLGVFIGPALLAMLTALWREITRSDEPQ